MHFSLQIVLLIVDLSLATAGHIPPWALLMDPMTSVFYVLVQWLRHPFGDPEVLGSQITCPWGATSLPMSITVVAHWWQPTLGHLRRAHLAAMGPTVWGHWWPPVVAHSCPLTIPHNRSVWNIYLDNLEPSNNGIVKNVSNKINQIGYFTLFSTY